MSKGKTRDGQQENNKEENVAGYALQDALIISLDNIGDDWVLDSRASFYATPIINIF